MAGPLADGADLEPVTVEGRGWEMIKFMKQDEEVKMLLWGALADWRIREGVVLLAHLYTFLEKEKKKREKGVSTGFTSEAEVLPEHSELWDVAHQ